MNAMTATANKTLAKAAAASNNQPQPPPAKINRNTATQYVDALGYSVVNDGNAKALAAKAKKSGTPAKAPADPKQPCRLFAAGHCKVGKSCIFEHVTAPPAKGSSPKGDGGAAKGKGK